MLLSTLKQCSIISTVYRPIPPSFALTHALPCVSYYFAGRDSALWATASSFTRFLDHTQTRTLGRTLLDE